MQFSIGTSTSALHGIPRYAVVALVLAFANPTTAQVPPPPGTNEVRYDGHPRYGDYPLFLYHGAALFVDLDGQDYMDLIMTGLRGPMEFASPLSPGYGGILTHRSLRVQVEPGVFDTIRYYERHVLNGFTDFFNNALAIGDYNNDGRPDIAASGRMRADEFTPFSMLVAQVDSLSFSIMNPGWLPVQRGSMAWGDYDNDGRSDLLLTGDGYGEFVTRVYQNQGDGSFQPVVAGLPNIGFGEAVWGDSDNDGDLDILLAGAQTGGRFVTSVFLNENGQFVDAGLDLPKLAFGHARWIDMNADGRLDILLAGAEQSPFILQGGFYIYINQGGNTFSHAPTDIPAHFDGDFDLIDWDLDGDIDILTSGFISPLGRRSARLYANEDGSFGIGYVFPHVIDMVFAVGDYDRDYDADLFVTGHSPEPFTLVPPVAAFFATQGQSLNAPPSPPSGLIAVPTASRVDLSWAPSTDDITPDPSLTYNLRVGTAAGGIDVVSPLADPISGKRFVCEQGNVFHNTSWHLDGLSPGTYYWSVQAVDQSCVGSTFAADGTFIVPGVPTDTGPEDTHLETRIEAGYPNPFRHHTSLRFTVPGPVYARLTIYDVLGRSVRTLVDGIVQAGTHAAVWDGTDNHSSSLPAGLYIYRLETAGTDKTGAVTLIR